MAVSLYQGKDPDTLNNIEIGQFTVEYIINLIEKIIDALTTKDFTAAKAPMAELPDILFYLES